MFKTLAIIGALMTPYINEPSKAITMNNEYEVINATNNQITLYQAYSDDYVGFQAKTFNTYPYKVNTEDGFTLQIRKSDYQTKPTNFYYIYKAADFEDPINITFQDVPSNVWVANISGYEPSRGIQIGQYESVSGKTYYINNQTISNLQFTNINGQQQSFNILDGYTAKLGKENGTFTSTLSNLTLLVTYTGQEYNNLIYLMLGSEAIASNFDPRKSANDPTALCPYLIFYNGYTNKVVFQSGNKTIVYGQLNGQDPFYFTTTNEGYKGEQGEFASQGDGWTALEAGIALVTKSFDVASRMFDWVIFPGITIGLFVLVPLMFSMVLWLIKLVKKGS